MTDIKLVAYIYEVNGERVELSADIVDYIKNENKYQMVYPQNTRNIFDHNIMNAPVITSELKTKIREIF